MGCTPTTIVNALGYHVINKPGAVAFTFLEHGRERTSDVSVTYAELHRRAQVIAAAIRHHCNEGERAAILCTPGLDYIAAVFGCFYAGVIAVPAMPPRGTRNAHRIQALFDDAQPSIALTSDAVLKSLPEKFKAKKP